VIVRILEEGQYEFDASGVDALNVLDDPLEAALLADDASAFADALEKIEQWVRTNGTPVDPTTIVPSDLVLPAPGSALAEVRELLKSEGEGV
jgi:hypothetical protein